MRVCSIQVCLVLIMIQFNRKGEDMSETLLLQSSKAHIELCNCFFISFLVGFKSSFMQKASMLCEGWLVFISQQQN